ncbi:hypothetical protein [Streptomyces cyaneofuscatus]
MSALLPQGAQPTAYPWRPVPFTGRRRTDLAFHQRRRALEVDVE